MKWVGPTRSSMAADEDTERKTVMTYVPAYQKERWSEHAEELGMSQSEFVRTMVQAGRRDFEVPSAPGRDATQTSEEPDDGASYPRGQPAESGFQNRVLDVLSESEYQSWDDLLAALTDDIESRLDETLQELQASNAVRYSGRHGGYALTPAEEQ
ncbi:hypothetical protein SAMN04488133_0156 [Halobellus limi]|uniref:Uncharacterized protein n=2 Tax=Halobellus limi TaxID=699433 RepID=A0A1H5T4U4_9EURY|nr:hypothetical protein SAMN04488133_0156 [Halobellus limi]